MRVIAKILALAHFVATAALAQGGFSAANGPMPGDLGRITREWECTQDLDTPGYFKSLNGAEVADSTRSQV